MRRSQRRGKENQWWRQLANVFKNDGDGNENQQPVDGRLHHSILSWAQAATVHLAGDNEKEAGGPVAHQDASEGFDAGDETPAFGEPETAVSHSGVSHDREI